MKNFPTFQFIIVLFLLITWNGTTAQEFAYDSIYKPSPNISGNAQFKYTKKNDRKIINGEFKFIREEKDSILENIAVHQTWNGRYNNNVKEGDWEYRTKQHKVKINEISQIDLDYDIISTDEILKITYKNGLPDQELTLQSDLYINGENVRVLEELKTNFSEYLVSGTFEYLLFDEEKRIAAVEGNAVNGLMEGKWVFEYFQDNVREERNYKKGILLNLKKWEDHDLVIDLEYPLSPQLSKIVNSEGANGNLVNKPLSLTFSDGYPRNSVYILEQKKGEEMLVQIFETIFKYDDNLNLEQQLSLGTNRGIYPLEKEEEESLKQWVNIEADYRQKTQQIKDLEIDNLSAVKDSTIQVVINWANKQKEIQDYIKPWNNIFSKEQVTYYNRKGLLKEYAENLLSNDTILANGEELVFRYETGEGNNFLNFITHNLSERTQVADSLYQEFSQRIEELSLNNEVIRINETIAAKKQTVDSIYSILPENPRISTVLQNVHNTYLGQQYPQQMQDFLSEKSASGQIDLGEEILANLQILEEIHQVALEIIESAPIIDELYTKYTFDPFTYSDRVPTRVKKRLYEIVAEQMIEHSLEQRIKPTNQPSNVLKELNLIKRLQERLAYLRDKDTDRLERRLRRTKSFSERVELLNNF